MESFPRIYCEKLAKPILFGSGNDVILQFSVSNFRAFRQVQTLNLAASNYDKSLPQNCIDSRLPGLKGRRWLKGAAIYGPNASGKSSLIDALRVLSELVSNSANVSDPREPIRQIEPFALAPNAQPEPTAFAITFVTKDVRYEYRVAATRERVCHESLRAFPNGKEQLWFCRNWSVKSLQYDWSPENPIGYKRDLKREEFTLPNSLFLSTATKLADTQLEPVFRWFKDCLIFPEKRPAVQDFGFGLVASFGGLSVSQTARELLEKGPHSDRILTLLRHADLGVTNALVKERDIPEEFLKPLTDLPPDLRSSIKKAGAPFDVLLFHEGENGQSIPLPWEVESTGTHRLFALAGPWLNVLSKTCIVCVDELDTSMHPLMVRELLKLMFSEKENANAAQLVFTTHNPLLLDPTLIRRDQIWFTDKDKEGAAHLYSLTDYQPRTGESLVRGYMTGRYGAVPFIPEGLLGLSEAPDPIVTGGDDER